MDCRWTRRSLVAFLDDELAPGDATRVADHVERCSACHTHMERLIASTPEAPHLELDDAARHALHLRLIDGLDRAPAAPEPVPRAGLSALLDLARGEIQVPRGLVALYAVLMVAVLGWAASGVVQPAPDSVVATDTAEEAPGPSAQIHQPAAYTPRDGWF